MTNENPRNLVMTSTRVLRLLAAKSAVLFLAVGCIGFSTQAETSRTKVSKTFFLDDQYSAAMTGLHRVMHRRKK